MKRTIRLTERRLHSIINECVTRCVKRCLNESANNRLNERDEKWDYDDDDSPASSCEYELGEVLYDIYKDGYFGDISEDEFDEIVEDDNFPAMVTMDLIWQYHSECSGDNYIIPTYPAYYSLSDVKMDSRSEQQLRKFERCGIMQRGAVDEIINRIYSDIKSREDCYYD